MQSVAFCLQNRQLIRSTIPHQLVTNSINLSFALPKIIFGRVGSDYPSRIQNQGFKEFKN